MAVGSVGFSEFVLPVPNAPASLSPVPHGSSQLAVGPAANPVRAPAVLPPAIELPAHIDEGMLSRYSLVANEQRCNDLRNCYEQFLASSERIGPVGKLNLQKFLVMLNMSSGVKKSGFDFGVPWAAREWLRQTMALVAGGHGVFSQRVDPALAEMLADVDRNSSYFFENEEAAVANARGLIGRLPTLPVGQSATIYGGYNETRDYGGEEPEFHSMYYRFQKLPSGNYRVFAYNAWGSGWFSGEHYFNGRSESRPFTVYEEVPLADLAPTIERLQQLLVKGTHFPPERNEPYATIFEGIGRYWVPPVNLHRLPGLSADHCERYIRTQRTNNCSIKSLNCLVLDTVADKVDAKRLNLEMRLSFLCSAFLAFEDELDGDPVLVCQFRQAIGNFVRILEINMQKPELGFTQETVMTAYVTARDLLRRIDAIEAESLAEEPQRRTSLDIQTSPLPAAVGGEGSFVPLKLEGPLPAAITRLTGESEANVWARTGTSQPALLEFPRFSSGRWCLSFALDAETGRWQYTADRDFAIDPVVNPLWRRSLSGYLHLVSADGTRRKVLVPMGQMTSEVGFQTYCQIRPWAERNGFFEYDLVDGELQAKAGDLDANVYLAHMYLMQKKYDKAALVLGAVLRSDGAGWQRSENTERLLAELVSSVEVDAVEERDKQKTKDYSANAAAVRLMGYYLAGRLGLLADPESKTRLKATYDSFLGALKHVHHAVYQEVSAIEPFVLRELVADIEAEKVKADRDEQTRWRLGYLGVDQRELTMRLDVVSRGRLFGFDRQKTYYYPQPPMSMQHPSSDLPVECDLGGPVRPVPAFNLTAHRGSIVPVPAPVPVTAAPVGSEKVDALDSAYRRTVDFLLPVDNSTSAKKPKWRVLVSYIITGLPGLIVGLLISPVTLLVGAIVGLRREGGSVGRSIFQTWLLSLSWCGFFGGGFAGRGLANSCC